MSKLLTIIIPQHSETEAMIQPLLASINQQVGIDLAQVSIEIIGDGGYRLPATSFAAFPKLNIDYHYYQPAQGPGHARQVGLELADSRYVAYFDADDQLSTVNALWRFVDVLNRTGDHDVIFSKYVEEYAPNDAGFNTYRVREFNPSAAYGKWLNLAFLREHRFAWHPLLPYAYEDTFFLDQVLVFANDVYKLDVPTYSWRYRPNSIVRTGADYNSVHLNEYFRENRLWAQAILQRAPQRLRFDVNNALVGMDDFAQLHPPVDKVKDAVAAELNQFLLENRQELDLNDAKKYYQQKHPNESVQPFLNRMHRAFKAVGIPVDQHPSVPVHRRLSIIVPIADGQADQLTGLLTSLQNQVGFPLSAFAVILVKDGGAPLPATIVQRFPQLTIELLHSKVQIGPGPARSLGMHHAASDYVMFCDADDDLHTVDALWRMDQAAQQNPQIVMAKYVNEQRAADGSIELQPWDYNQGAVYPHWFNLAFLNAYLLNFEPALHGYYEDTYFSGLAFRIAKNVTYVDQPVYTHRLNAASLIHQHSQADRQRRFLIEYARENYYWFQAVRARFPHQLRADFDNFVVNYYYMYESYGLESTSLDQQIRALTIPIVRENSDCWHGWSPKLQAMADARTTGDAANVDAKHLRAFIDRFF